MRQGNTKLYSDIFRPYVQDALRYLGVTQDGKQRKQPAVSNAVRRGTGLI